ncbi:MAG: hypothetical protein HYU78_12805 [Rhodocyclales bacterium]|nr:hypothetical protein [Rhodocyclales bacterium]
MKRLLPQHPKAQQLHPNLLALLNAGICVRGDYVFLAKLLSERQIPTLDRVGDETGIEVFVNSFHTDDYIEDDHLPQALAFASAEIELWAEKHDFGSHEALSIVITVTEYGVNIKLFKNRPQQPYLSDRLEDYPEPVMLIRFP